MKVIQVNCVYNSGSTGKIVYDICGGLKNKGHEFVVCYGRGKKVDESNVYKVSTELEAKIHSALWRLFGLQFGFSPIATAKTINIIKKEKPDAVHLHCLNGNFINVYRLLNFLKKQNIKTILTLHAEIMHTAGCDHAYDCEKWKTECCDCPKIDGKFSKYFRDDAKYCYRKMQKAFKGFNDLTVIGVSEWLTQRAKLSPIFPENVHFETIHNGVNTDVFTKSDFEELYEKYNIPGDKKIVLHVTPNFNYAIKGGEYVLQAAKKMPEYQFVIVGFNDDKSILPSNVLPINHTDSKEEMAKFYSLADVTLLTSKRETFSMVVAESLCCGTPVVGFLAGAPETITIPEYSSFAEFGNVELLCEKIKKILSIKFDKQEISDKARKKYAFINMVKKYISMYKG